MEEYKFSESWVHISTPPLNAERCLVTDGDLVIIATYLINGDKDVWMFQGLTDNNFKVISWMPLPRPPKKIMEYVEKNNASSKNNN